MKKKNLFLKSTSSLLAMLFVVMSAFMFTSCDETDDPNPDDEEPENSILEIISSSDNHTQLAAYLELYPNLLGVISDTTASLTVFAPNDAAFATLEGTLDTDLGNVSPAVIEAVLAFHVHTGGAVLRADISENTELSTAQGEKITFDSEGNVATGGSVTSIPYDGDEILATNGVVHSVENILIPPVQVFSVVAEHLGKVSQAILLGADFTTLAAAINKADVYAEAEGKATLKSILSNQDAELTVFAPVNQVFEQFFQQPGASLEEISGEEWYGLILNHVLTETVLAANLTGTYTSAAGSPITVLPSGGLDSNGEAGAEATIAAPDAFVSQINGVVHAIAGILTFPTPNVFAENNIMHGYAIDYGVYTPGYYNYDFILYSGDEIDPTSESIPDGSTIFYIWTESEGEASWSGGEFTFGNTGSGSYLNAVELVKDANLATETVDEPTSGNVEITYDGSTLQIISNLTGEVLFSGEFNGTVSLYQGRSENANVATQDLINRGIIKK
jgi:transforming growth factor-beta-induced protein